MRDAPESPLVSDVALLSLVKPVGTLPVLIQGEPLNDALFSSKLFVQPVAELSISKD